MTPIQHPTSNDALHPPAGATPGECRPLFITRVVYDHPFDSSRSAPGVISYWQPTPEQLALLNAGAPVWLSVLGATHPPLAIGVEGDGRL